MAIDRVFVEDVGKFDGQVITLKGWLYNKRSSGKIWFLLLRDGTGVIQGVVSGNDVSPEVFDLYERLTQESSIIITGQVHGDKRAPGGYELWVKDVRIIQTADDFPITPKEHGTAFLMERRHLWIRSRRQNAILKIRHEIIKAIRDYFDSKKFTLVDAPIFTPAACEGTTTLFETDYFGEKAYLTQSGQLYMEAAAMAFGKVYCFGPTFRAEKSKTRRHLTEFWMVEPEVAYADLNDIMGLAEELIEFIVTRVLENRLELLKILERDLSKLETIKRPFPRIHYDEAAAILKGADTEFVYGSDFGGADETLISNNFDRPVMVYQYPADVKAFYMKNNPDDPSKALCVDVLAPEGYGEIIGGGQREDDLDTLKAKIQKQNLPEEAFDWYLDLRKYGSVPHGGFGLGIERTVGWICGLEHVRETIPFPRLMHRIYP
ncbi:asparagine--tRNA ligase [bacterium BMS3Abin05]|nr:asparagine--tRNA ligase [bacterium BMS3Abin05]GBE28961.1 asparagine--tRNA ligase [bacterium BMS3Bbin03]HDL79074.1 asparagine--tRNA ligase [Bacteroidota bacterium]HDZ13191.1 asparagine--tRNA ligase [Bacteroidota bacterium]